MILTRGITKNKRIYLLVKSDRINALRKQYDAFLEEDKKRRERNEYILGKLDKMRYSAALVPVRHKPTIRDTRAAIVNNLGYHQPDRPSIPDFQSSTTNQTQLFPNIPIQNNEDTYLIQQISKKYILIPKLRPTVMNNYLGNLTINPNTEKLHEIRIAQDTIPVKDLIPDTAENNDWKSKYEILNILKNEEKEKQSENLHDFVDTIPNIQQETVLHNNQENIAFNRDTNLKADDHLDLCNENVKDFPEKEFSTATLPYELSEVNEYNPDNTPSVNLKTDTSSESNERSIARQVDAIDYEIRNMKLEYDKNLDQPKIEIVEEITDYKQQVEHDANMVSIDVEFSSKQDINVNEQNIYPEEEYQQNTSAQQHRPAELEQVYLEDSEINPVQLMNPDKVVEEINYYEPTIPVANDHVSEGEHLTEISNIQVFESNHDIQMKTDTNINEEKTDIQSNVDPIEKTEPVPEQTENPININESIEDFNAEQRDLFYTEQVDDNNPNQTGDATAYNPGYAQGDYPQNQEYTYYENTSADSYPVQLNDEDIKQLYDPSYEQQYIGPDQGMEQYDQQYQAPVESNQLETQFEVPQFEQQYENQEQIEETLDVEDGFISQQSEVKPGIQKSDTEEVPASEQMMG